MLLLIFINILVTIMNTLLLTAIIEKLKIKIEDVFFDSENEEEELK